MGLLFALMGFVGLIHFLAFYFWAACGVVMLVTVLQTQPIKMWVCGFCGWFVAFACIFLFFKTVAVSPMIDLYLTVGSKMMQASNYFGCMIEFGPELMSLVPEVCQN